MQKRILAAVIFSITIILATLGLISYLRVQDSIERSYGDRLGMSSMVGKYIEHILEENLTRLYDISLSDRVDFTDNDWMPERAALKAAYEYSIFTDGVFMLDQQASVRLTYPYRESAMVNLLGNPHVSQAVRYRKPVISNVFTEHPSGRKVIYVLVPLRNRSGDVVGAVGGVINPTNSMLSRALQTVQAEVRGNHYIEIIDANEVVVTSDKPARILEHHDHGGILSKMIKARASGVKFCSHGYSQAKPDGLTKDILAFVPLTVAPWGVIFGQSEQNLLMPADQLKTDFVLLAVLFTGTALVFAAGVSRTIVVPLRTLTAAANGIAKGDLTRPVGDVGTDEVGALARSFEVMRERLARSLDSIHQYSTELESRVYERTMQLEDKRRQNELLLKKLISSQEDERKRVARELHDEALQTLSAILMSIEMCRLHPELITPEKVSKIKETVVLVINDMNNVIQNLRPTVLDDLGFEAAVAWILDRNLRDKGIHCELDTRSFVAELLAPQMEIALFRIIQEASSNIARHAGAKNTYVHIRNDQGRINIYIDDDGDGFDTRSALETTFTGRGLGIMGMKERASLMNGRLTVCSTPGAGTMIFCTIPCPREA
ncbi:MAG TPA: hypothetical protein DCS05_10610 [Nitrospiraceae bacterium]|nr:hypothetical protein [Nitrospiraceae bacterium]